MRKLLEIVLAGLRDVSRHPARSGAVVASLTALLAPFLAGLSVAAGLRWQAEAAVRSGADLCVGGVRFGRPTPVPVNAIPRIERMDGVVRVRPRIVGEVRLGSERLPATLVGLDAIQGTPPADLSLAAGRWFNPHRPGELVVGSELADKLSLEVGSRIPPFYRNVSGERVSTVVGVFRSDVSLWQARLVVTSFATAEHVFDQPGWATDLLVECRPGYERQVAERIVRQVTFESPDLHGQARPRVTTRQQLESAVAKTFLHREGVFNLHFVLAFGVGIPLLAVVSGVGLAERRREVAVLRTLGWQIDELLLRALAETLALAAASAVLAALLAWFWLRVLNGWVVAGVFIAGADAAPQFDVPFRLVPLPLALTCGAAVLILTTGALWSNWRAAVAPPALAMR